MRIISSLRNVITTVIPYFIITFLGFCKTRGFILNLGEDIYSINQVFYQIFIYLSLAESGIGIVAYQKYYQLFIKGDQQKINEIYSASKKVLRRVAFIIVALGIILSFGLKIITKNDLSLGYLQIVFILFLFRNIIDYFMFSPRLVIQADQKAYKINWWINLFRILELLIELKLIYLKVNYIIILIPSIFTRILMNLVINKVVYHEYPWLKEVKDADTSLLSGTKDFMVHKVSNIIYSNTDLIIISTFLNSASVVIYASYNYIVAALNEILNIITESITPSLGNAINKETTDTSYEIFEEQNSLFSFFAMFFTSCMVVLIKSFVSLWIGADKILDNFSLSLIALSFFYSISSRVVVNVIHIKGWYKETKRILIIEAMLNVGLSIVLVNLWGIFGVVLATVISNFMTKFFYFTNYVYKRMFHKKAIYYYLNFVLDLLITAVFSLIFVYKLENMIIENYIQWGIMAMIVGIILFAFVFLYKFIFSPHFRKMTEKIWYTIKQKFVRA